MSEKLRRLVMTAMLMALTCVATMIAIPLPMGYLNLGDSMVFLAGFLMGPYYGMIAAAIGSSLADFLLGYPQYMITTFIVKGIMGYAAGKAKNMENKKRVLVCILAGLIMVAGYYITEVILYGSYLSPLATAPMSVLQFSIGLFFALLLKKALKKFEF